MNARRPVAAAYAGGALEESCSTCGAQRGEPCTRVDERTKARITRAIPCMTRIHPGAIQLLDDDQREYVDITVPRHPTDQEDE